MAPFFMMHFASEGSIQSLELLLWKSEKDALTHVLGQIKGRVCCRPELSCVVLQLQKSIPTVHENLCHVFPSRCATL